MKDLLIVEDDPTLGEGIRLASRRRSSAPSSAGPWRMPGSRFSRRSFDLLILTSTCLTAMDWTSSVPSGGRVRFL